jgi:hypothetical protein
MKNVLIKTTFWLSLFAFIFFAIKLIVLTHDLLNDFWGLLINFVVFIWFGVVVEKILNKINDEQNL